MGRSPALIPFQSTCILSPVHSSLLRLFAPSHLYLSPCVGIGLLNKSRLASVIRPPLLATVSVIFHSAPPSPINTTKYNHTQSPNTSSMTARQPTKVGLRAVTSPAQHHHTRSTTQAHAANTPLPSTPPKIQKQSRKQQKGGEGTNKPKTEKIRIAGAGNSGNGPCCPGIGCARPPRRIGDCVAAGESSLDCSSVAQQWCWRAAQ